MTGNERGATPETTLMLFGVTGFCADCGDERLLVPVDDDRLDYCCTGCDGAVALLPAAGRPRRVREYAARRAG